MKTNLSQKPKLVHNFQFEHGCLLVTDTVDFNGKVCRKLYVQIIDAYRYQRELSIEFARIPGRSDDACYHWDCHAYKHPGIRAITQPSPAVAKKLIARLITLADTAPTLLFNRSSIDANTCDARARHEGFVHFHDALLNGAAPSVRLLP